MLLPHAHTLSRARTALAALADTAPTIDTSSEYEHVLIELDRIHGDQCPALSKTQVTHSRKTLLAIATTAIDDLTTYGVDPLDVELVLAMLEDAAGADGA